MGWNKVKIGSFLKEREDRLTPDEANKTGLDRLEKIDFTGNIHIAKNKPTKTGMILVKKGDLVISGINVEKGAVSVYQGDEDVLATIHYSSYMFNEEKIDIGYFIWFLKSKAFKDIVNAQIKSGIKTELKPKRFLPLEIDLPDIDTQKQIRGKINGVSMEIQETTGIFFQNEKLVSKLRQSILFDAVSGKLVPQDPNDEPASVLLERIREEHPINKIKHKFNRYNILDNPIKDDLNEFPENWDYTRVAYIADVDPRNYIEDDLEVSFIPMPLLQDGYGSSYTYDIKKWKEVKSGFTHFKEGDVAIAKITPCFQNKKSTVFNKLKNGYGAGTTEFYILRPFREINPHYLLLLFKRDIFIKSGISTFKGMAGQQRVKKEFVLNYEIPLPPINEQKRIVEKVNQLFSFCDELEKEVKKSQTNATRLIDAVLRDAFKVEA